MAFIVKNSDIDLSTVELESIFINDFMPQADGIYVKIYLFGLKLAKESSEREFTIKTISSNLNIEIDSVISAYKYWQDKKIVNIVNIRSSLDFDVEYLSIRSLYITQNYVNASKVKDMMKKSFENQKMNDLYERINALVNVKLLPVEWESLLEFIEEYNVDEGLIIGAFENLGKVGVKSRVKVVKTNIVNWMDSGIKSYEELVEYKNQNTERFKLYKEILKALGYPYQQPTIGDKETIDKWIDVDGYSLEKIIDTIKQITKNKREPSLNYINSVLLGKQTQSYTKEKKASSNVYSNEQIKEKMLKKVK
jgi:DNA replication protein DnaD